MGDSNVEGRQLALETLWSFVHFRLWPTGGCQRRGEDLSAEEVVFFNDGLSLLMSDPHAGIRSATMGLWAQLNDSNARYVLFVLMVGRRVQPFASAPSSFWRWKV